MAGHAVGGAVPLGEGQAAPAVADVRLDVRLDVPVDPCRLPQDRHHGLVLIRRDAHWHGGRRWYQGWPEWPASGPLLCSPRAGGPVRRRRGRSNARRSRARRAARHHHGHRQCRRRHGAARPRHQPRPRHRHLHPGRHGQPRDRVGAWPARAGRSWTNWGGWEATTGSGWATATWPRISSGRAASAPWSAAEHRDSRAGRPPRHRGAPACR